MALRIPGQHAPVTTVTPPPTTAIPNPAPLVFPAGTAPDLVAEVAREVAGAIALADHASIANQTADLPNFANSVTGVYGISGSGKTSLIVTACEFCWEEFEMISLVYATDLGGFGNKMLSLVRNGIVRVWDPRNHVNSFETMEACSLGAWPEHIDDPETGKAAPNVRLIMPRRIVTSLVCPQGHAVGRFELSVARDAALFESGSFPCPTCGVVTSKANGTTQAQIVRHRMFSRVGHRGYDSLTEMNDWGMMRLGEMSAKGLLPTGKEGGSLLGSADALREGSVTYGGGSPSQVGFMQNRSYQWIANIRSIPDQVMPATCTFAVEQGKADDDSGGVPILGPQIAGNARTAKVPRWVGNCLHASREPDDVGNMRYRLWLTSHLDSRDVRKIPYLAKHRGIPLDMPDYLEDPWDADPQKRAAAAWSVCSLGNFYRKLIAQLAKLEAAQKLKYANAPGLKAYETGDDVIENVGAPAMIAPAGVNAPVAGGPTMAARRGALRVPGAVVAPTPGPPPVSIPVQTTVAPAAAVAQQPPVAQPAPEAARTTIPGGLPAGLVVEPTAAGTGSVATATPTPAASSVHPVVPAASSVLEQQLKASLELRNAGAQAPAGGGAATAPQPAASTPSAAVTPQPTPSTAAVSSPAGRLRSPGALRTPGAAAAASSVITAPPTTVSTVAPAVPPAATVAPVPTVAPIAPVLPAASMPAPAPPPRLAARRTPRPPV